MKRTCRKMLPLLPPTLVGLWFVLSLRPGNEAGTPAGGSPARPEVAAAVPERAGQVVSPQVQAALNVVLKQAAPDAAPLVGMAGSAFQPHWDAARNRPFYTVAEPAVAALRQVAAGQKMSLPLPDHGLVEVTVHASLPDEQRETFWSIGGEIGEGQGSLYLAEDTATQHLSGVVMLRNRREAWVYERTGTGDLKISERAVSEIVCTGEEGLPPIGLAGTSATGGDTPPPVHRTPRSSGASGTVPACSSKAGATSVLYLDFEGGTATQTFWNSGRATTYESAGMDTNQMISLWSQVAEDFASFDVNVTTVRSTYTAASAGRRMRIILAKTSWEPTNTVGFAGIGSFPNAGGFWSERARAQAAAGFDVNVPDRFGATPYPAGYGPTMSAIVFPSDIVCWAFGTPLIRPLEKKVAEQVKWFGRAATHELGHTFGLLHDSLFPRGGAFDNYYDGHGTDADRWNALMGANYDSLAQWSKAEYTDAINRGWGTQADGTTRALQDDIAMIGSAVAGGSGTGLVADDKGDTAGTAPLLAIDGLGMVSDGGKIHIGTDNDMFRIPIVANSSVIDLTITASGEDTNLDVYAELQNSAGTTLTSSVPLADRNARIGPFTVNASGNYYLLVSGSFQGTASTGWTRYGNLGTYSINGSVTGSGGAPVITASSLPPDGSVGISYTYPLAATNNPTSYYLVSGTVPPGLLLSGGSLTGIPTSPGWYNFTLAAANGQGGTSKFFTMYVFGPATLAESLEGFPIVWTTTSPPTNPAASLWQGQRAISFDGSDAARSGSIGANSESILSTNLKGPGKLTFYWRTSSHTGDRLIFKLGSTEQFNIGGETSWEQRTVLIGQGTFPVSWIYRTDPGTTAGQNAGFVDQVSYQPYPEFADGNFHAGGRVGAAFLREIPLEGTAVPTTWALTGGALPPGITLNAATGTLSGVPSATGTYEPEITATNAGGSSTTYPSLFIYPDISLPAGVDAEGLIWVTDPVNPWFGDNTNTRDGTDVGHSGPIRHGLSSYMQTTVNGPGTFSFWWKCSTEATDDPGIFSLNGTVQASISGETGWTQQTYNLGTGPQTLRWTYVRDGSGNGGSNMVWVDQVSWITPGPTITSPLTVNWSVGGTYTVPLTSDDPNAMWSVTGTLPSDIFFIPEPTRIIGAVPRLPRVVTFTLNATNASGTTTSRLFTANIESSYTVWARNKGLAVGTPLGDPDRDGIVNIAECAFGLEPNVRNAGFQPVSYDPATRRLRAVFNRRHQYYPDLKYEVQVSTNLQTWTSIATVDNGVGFTNGGALSITETQVSPHPDPIYQATVIDGTAQTPAAPRRIMRVKITQM